MAKKYFSKNTDRSGDDYVLVFSTDKSLANNCSVCGKPSKLCECGAKSQNSAKPGTCKIRFEKKGRGGKSVTVLSGLMASHEYLKALCSHLKRSTGSGGTFYVEKTEGIIEIQGDRQTQVRQLFDEFEALKRISK